MFKSTPMTPGAKGMTAHISRAAMTTRMGAALKATQSAPEGWITSFVSSFMTSATVCNLSLIHISGVK